MLLKFKFLLEYQSYTKSMLYEFNLVILHDLNKVYQQEK